MRQTLGVVLLLGAGALHGAGGTLKNPAQPLLWSGAVTRGAGPVGEVPECAPGCQRFDLDISLPGGVWNQKPGGVQIALRWDGGTFGDNLRLYVYRGATLIAKSDGIIAIAQAVLLPEPPDGNLRVYVAYDPDSTTNPLPYEAVAQVQYPPNPRPIRRLLPDMEPRPQRNLGFDPLGIFFDVVSTDFPTCYQSEVDEEAAHLCLRFDQIFANTGEGAMDLRFSVPAGTTPPLADVFQRIYWSDSPTHFEDRLAGQVEFHPAHGHYHFTSFGLSRLWAADTAGLRQGGQPLREQKMKRTVPLHLAASGRKVSFCLADTEIDSWAKQGVGPRTYIAPDCLLPAATQGGRDYFVQGITAGWGDIYDFYLPDQYIEVSGVADGDYILENRSDPDGLLVEARDDNNCTSIRIRLHGMSSASRSVEVLGPGPACSLLHP